MDSLPETPKVLGMFTPKQACYFISLIGLGIGGIGLVGLILYGLVEDSIIGKYIKGDKTDESVKKAVLLTIGLTSLLLFVGSVLLFLGGTFTSSGCMSGAAWVYFGMNFFIIIEAIAAPMSCFFLNDMCLIKKVSSATMVLGYFIVYLFLNMWLYFMVVVFNQLAEMG